MPAAIRHKNTDRSLYQKKIEQLYHYYMAHGFDHSVEMIAEGMGISTKTFFNRYHSKEYSLKLTFDLWMKILAKRIRERLADCNNAVEKLVLFMTEVEAIAAEKTPYYQFAVEHHLMTDVKAPFSKIVIEILQEGKQHYQVWESLDSASFSDFFLFNVFNYVIDRKFDGNLIRYLLVPAMNDRGEELMDFVISSLETHNLF